MFGYPDKLSTKHTRSTFKENTMSMFEIAVREKYRFPSTKGELSVENLWDLPLQSKIGCDLDTVAKGLYHSLKAMAEESFVKATNPAKGELERKLEVVKYIIQVRLAENESKVNAARRQDEIRKLEELLSQKKDQALLSLTAQEIEAQLQALRQA